MYSEKHLRTAPYEDCTCNISITLVPDTFINWDLATMSTKAVSKKFSLRAVSKVARKLSFRSAKPVARTTPPAVEELQTLTRTSSFNLLPTTASELADLQQQQPVEEVPEPEPKEQDPEVEAAKLRVARRFFLKRTKRFYGTQGYLAQCPLGDRSRIIKSLMNIKDSVKSTISQALPKTKTLTKMTNTMVNTLRGQGLPECFRYLGITSVSDSQRGAKRKRDYEEESNVTTYMNGLNLTRRQNAKKKCESKSDDFKFAKPTIYECGYCNDSFFHHAPFFKHIRSHEDTLRCVACYRKFEHIIPKRQHELKCRLRSYL